MIELSQDEESCVEKLIGICKQYGGSSDSDSGDGRRLRAYDRRFIHAAAEIYIIMRERFLHGYEGVKRERMKGFSYIAVVWEMSKRFDKADIRSCHGMRMMGRMDYLYENHLKEVIDEMDAARLANNP